MYTQTPCGFCMSQWMYIHIIRVQKTWLPQYSVLRRIKCASRSLSLAERGSAYWIPSNVESRFCAYTSTSHEELVHSNPSVHVRQYSTGCAGVHAAVRRGAAASGIDDHAVHDPSGAFFGG